MEPRIWLPQGAPRAVVQLVHGMAEHLGRYEALARRLNEAGFVVAGINHRGHGPEAKRLGWFAERDGWRLLVEDAHQVTLQMKKQYPGLPFVLLGHSMGSFVAREYALRYGEALSCLVLSGTGWYGAPLCGAGWLLARLSPAYRPAALVNRIAFSGNNRPFAPARTAFDWLSRDEAQVDAYIQDPLCGFVFTGSAFRDFFGGLIRLTRRERLLRMPKALPAYFLSGECDPVGQMGKGVEQVAAQLRGVGMQDVTVRLYPGARHELFHEINRDEVFDQLIGWLNGHI